MLHNLLGQLKNDESDSYQRLKSIFSSKGVIFNRNIISSRLSLYGVGLAVNPRYWNSFTYLSVPWFSDDKVLVKSFPSGLEFSLLPNSEKFPSHMKILDYLSSSLPVSDQRVTFSLLKDGEKRKSFEDELMNDNPDSHLRINHYDQFWRVNSSLRGFDELIAKIKIEKPFFNEASNLLALKVFYFHVFPKVYRDISKQRLEGAFEETVRISKVHAEKIAAKQQRALKLFINNIEKGKPMDEIIKKHEPKFFLE